MRQTLLPQFCTALQMDQTQCQLSQVQSHLTLPSFVCLADIVVNPLLNLSLCFEKITRE